jgi:hypothetical protein
VRAQHERHTADGEHHRAGEEEVEGQPPAARDASDGRGRDEQEREAQRGAGLRVRDTNPVRRAAAT